MPKIRHKAPESMLLKRTRELLNEHKLTYHEISMATGLPSQWVARLAVGKEKDPGVSRVEAVYVALTGQPLSVR